MSTISVIIASDSMHYREALSNILSKVPHVFKVLAAVGADEVSPIAVELQPEAIVVAAVGKEVPFPLFCAMKTTCPQTALILVTDQDDAEIFWGALKAGADACVGTIVPGYLARVLEMVCRGGIMAFPRSLKGHLQKAGAVSSELAPEVAGELTSREKEIFGLLLKKLSNKEIARRLFISEATVKTHVRNVLRKVGAPNRVGLTENPDGDNR